MSRKGMQGRGRRVGAPKGMAVSLLVGRLDALLTLSL